MSIPKFCSAVSNYLETFVNLQMSENKKNNIVCIFSCDQVIDYKQANKLILYISSL